jgi:probable F420-dependent oxidoreductase
MDRDMPLEGPYSDEVEFHEPLVLCGYLAAVTSTIELMTGVLVLPQRQTALVAKQAAQIDLLSEGRFRLAIGTGWNHVEYEALGMPYAVRGQAMEEQVDVLRQLWTKENVDFRGDYHRIDNASIRPLPLREIPIWFGGYAPVAIRRAARLGSGFFFGGSLPMMQRGCALLHEELAMTGRDSSTFGIDVTFAYGEGPEGWIENLHTWKALGATHITMRAMSAGAKNAFTNDPDPGFTKPQQHIDALEPFIASIRSELE